MKPQRAQSASLCPQKIFNIFSVFSVVGYDNKKI